MKHCPQEPPLADGDQKREPYIGTRGLGDDIMVSSYSPLLSLVAKRPLIRISAWPACMSCRHRIPIRLSIPFAP